MNALARTRYCLHSSALLFRGISTVEAGTAYENLVVSTVNELGAKLERVGGANDHGIDFRGPWFLPKQSPFYVVGQCKFYERKKVGPSLVREWEGVMSRQDDDTLGIIAASSGFTPQGMRTALSSQYPMALVTLREHQSRGCEAEAENDPADIYSPILGFVWNQAAALFLGKLIVTKKHFNTEVVDVDDPAHYTIQLIWDGQPLPMHK